MPQVVLSIVYGVNTGLVFNAYELIERYLHGIPLVTKDGRAINLNVITDKIRVAQKELEHHLAIKIKRQVITESRDFIRNDYMGWGFVKLTYLVRQVLDLTGFISTVRQLEFPDDWVSSKVTSEEDLRFRNLHIVPAGSSNTTTNSVAFVGITPQAGFFGIDSIPNYWRIKYATGFKVVPSELRDVIGKLAAVQLLAILGDILFGPGISSKSLSLDGLSQSLGTTNSSGSSTYGARIKQYQEELKDSMAKLKDWYKGILYTAM